jgi:hypothetical protein
MASRFFPSPAETAGAGITECEATKPPVDDLLVVVGCGNPVLADFVAFARRNMGRRVVVVAGDLPPDPIREGQPLAGLVLFLDRRASDRDRALHQVAAIARATEVERICLVSDFRVHFGDRRAIRAEAEALDQVQHLAARTVVFRPSHVLSRSSRARALLQALWFLHPIVPARFSTCCIDGEDLFAAIEQELNTPAIKRSSRYTLLGLNRPWRSLLREQATTDLLRRCLAVVCAIVGLFGVAQALAVLVAACCTRIRGASPLNFRTLHPESIRELLELYNKYTYRQVKIVGYNNGVVHFGQKYPGKTIVSTLHGSKLTRIHGESAQFDAGVTVRRAVEVLGHAGKELYVVPNYSYVCLGTSFFVPIHGSASEFCTLGDTIDRVLLYDPKGDRFIGANRNEPAFQHHIYNLDADVLLLRLRCRVKGKSLYYLKRSKLEHATARQILDAFSDPHASNVEIRQSRAGDPAIEVCKYFTKPPAGDTNALPFPKDSLGKLWDKLESNPISAALFHGFVRRFLCHVELFFSPEEFAVFWETHKNLPVWKIQLRYIKRDGLPHSPFLRHDCVSVDMSMLRKRRRAFEAYLKETFRAVQFNPGKHSL